MPYAVLLHPEPLPLWQSTADPYLHRRHSNTVLSQSLWVSGSWYVQGLFEPSERLWQKWGLILNVISSLLPSYWGFSALGCGVSPHSCSCAMQSHNDLYFQGTRCHFFFLFFFFFLWYVGYWFMDQEWNPCPLQWKCGILITGPPGKSQGCQFEHYYQGK